MQMSSILGCSCGVVTLRRELQGQCSLFLFLNNFIYLWPYWGFSATQAFSLVPANGGSFLVMVHRFLIAVASLVAEHIL